MTSETLQPRESKQMSVLRSWTKKSDKYLTISQIQQHEAVSRRCSSVSFLETITKACNMALPFQFADKILQCDHVKKATERHFGCCFAQQSNLSDTIQMKASVQYFPIAPFIMLYKVIQIFQSVNEIWRCDQSNETSPGLCTHRTICLVGSSKFRVCRGNPYRWCDQSNKETK